jgi:hypothetical protein
LPVYTGTVDSIIATSYSSYSGVFGNICVAPYRNMAADLIFRIYPYVGEHSFGEDPEFVSASLTLIIGGRSVPDDNLTNMVQNIRLHTLKRELSYDSTYYNNSITPNDYDALINQAGTTYNGGDTLVIPLTETFGKFLLEGAASDMDSLSHFFAKYKGFALSVDPLPDGITGGRLNTTDISTAYLLLNYTDSGKDTSMVYYGDYGLVFSRYEHSSGYLADYINDTPPATVKDTVYFESLAGVKPVFDAAVMVDSLDALLARTGLRREQFLINKAELVLSIDRAATMDKYPSTLALYYRNTTKTDTLSYTAIDDISGTSFGGAINRSLQTYSFNLTYFLQHALRTASPNADRRLYLFPTTTITDTYGYSYTVIDNMSYTYGQFFGAANCSPAKLKLVYTILQ